MTNSHAITSYCRYCERPECDTDCSFADRHTSAIARRTAEQWRALGAAEVVTPVDEVPAERIKYLLGLLQRVMSHLQKHAGSPAEQKDFQEAFAELAAHGKGGKQWPEWVDR